MSRLLRYMTFIGLVCCLSSIMIGVLNYYGVVHLDDQSGNNLYVLYSIGGMFVLFPVFYTLFKKDS